MNKITGKVLLENGQVFEREFDSVNDFLLADYYLTRDKELSYDFYFGGKKIERLQPKEGEDEVGFPEEDEFLLDEIVAYIFEE